MPQPLNILLITADDLNCNSVGAFGSTVGATPNIDALAAEGMRFSKAHVNVAVCQPSRGAIATGRFPHRSGQEGFYHIHNAVPTVMGVLREQGYFTACLGKLDHSTPHESYKWDIEADREELGQGRDPASYGKYMRDVFDAAAAQDKPFYLMLNSHDPHRPFHGSDQEIEMFGGPLTTPSKVYQPDEVDVPGFLPDIPDVRLEMAEYFSSTRRLDDTVGVVLAELEDAGLADSTLVAFLSDNGMALPFAKTNCYLHSTRTPLIVRWPGQMAPGSVDETHYVSGIDLMPTFLDAAGFDVPKGVDGFSFAAILRGGTQDGRDHVYTQFHETAGARRYPMRCIHSGKYCYIFNAWANGERVFLNESQSGRSFAAMKRAAQTDDAIAARVKHFVYRQVEELYDTEADPDALHNLIDEPAHAATAAQMRVYMAQWLERTGDPAVAAFEHRDWLAAREVFMAAQQTVATIRRANRA